MNGPVTIQHNQQLNSLVCQPLRANTIHRTLVGPNQIALKHPGKKKMKSGIRKGGPYEQQAQNLKSLYATTSQNSRGPPSNQRMMSVNSNNQQPPTTKQFAQVRLRQDLSIKSNKSPNRYSQVSASLKNPQQQTISYHPQQV